MLKKKNKSIDFDDIFDAREEEIHRRAVDKLDSIEEFRKLDEHNPTEQALKFEKVKQNPPEPGFMQVEVYNKRDDGKPGFTTVATDKKNCIVEKIKHPPFMVIDLLTAIKANIAQAPMSIVPMLIDQAQKVVDLEKKTFTPEKVKNEFNWWWIVFIVLIIIGISPLLLLFLGGAA